MLNMECKPAYRAPTHKVNAFNRNGVSDRHKSHLVLRNVTS